MTPSPLLMSAKRALMAFVSAFSSVFKSLNRPGGGGGGGGGGPPDVTGRGPENTYKTRDSLKPTKKKHFVALSRYFQSPECLLDLEESRIN